MHKLLKKYLYLASVALFSLLPLNAIADEQLIFVVDLIRHGDRTPLAEIPKSPHVWKEGFGELTAEGMRQEFQLGRELRKRYVDQYHLLPPYYSADSLYVRSTDLNRTLMSAESFLYGLYPLPTGPNLANSTQPALPERYQPIPIHTTPKDQDDLLIVKPSKNIFALIKYYFSTRTSWEEKTAGLQDKFKRWDEITGLKTNSRSFNRTSDFNLLSDNLYIRKLHGVTLPNGISSEDATKILSIGESTLLSEFKYQAITYPMGHKFLTEVANYLQQASQQKNPLKYAVFFGHDSSILSVMNTLGTPLNELPELASQLNFSLFENNHMFYVKVNFNNKPVTIPACGGNTCLLSQFVELAKK